MPLGAFEREVLRLLAASRNPDSYVAGATVLHRSADSPRASRDVDIFHDTAASLAAAHARDLEVLRAAGYAVEPGLIGDTFRRVVVRRGGLETKSESGGRPPPALAKPPTTAVRPRTHCAATSFQTRPLVPTRPLLRLLST